MLPASTPKISQFRGLNNVTDPRRAGASWLTRADNVDVTDSGGLKKRAGYIKTLSGAMTAAYSTLDMQRCYMVDGDALKALTSPATTVTLRTGLAPRPMHFTEVDGRVYFNNGVDDGIILPDNSIQPWRDAQLDDIPRLDADGKPMDTLLSPLPQGVDRIQHWRGRIYAAQWLPGMDSSALWFSQPIGYHLFNMDEDVLMLSGQIRMLAPHDAGLVIGTDRAIHVYTGESLAQVADYGVVPGEHWALDNRRLLFWTQRGLCAGLPFENLTDAQVSVAPGASAAGALVQDRGATRYVVSLQQGGTAFNNY